MSNNDSKKTYNIMVLGATGVGKSTLVNALPNLLKNECYDQLVETDDLKIVIGGQFNHNESNNSENILKCHPIRFQANAAMSARHQLKNQNNDSSIQRDETQRTQSYLFRTKDCDYRIIDTPGVQDARGAEVDKENFEEVIQYISQFKSIEAVLIVLGNDVARITSTFRYSLQEVFVHLHKDLCKNIIFAFTHTIINNFTPGDSLMFLRAVLKNLEANNIIIPTTRNNIFCFDSVWLRELLIIKQGYSTSYDDNKMDDCFMKNKTEMKRMLEKVKSNSSHRTMETVRLNSVRNLVYSKYHPLSTMERKFPTQINVIELVHPSIACTICISFVGEKKIKTYKECHQRCHLADIQVANLGNPSLSGSELTDESGIRCSECDCPWEKHVLMRYRLEERLDTSQDQQELEKIKKYSTEFCVYIKQNAIAPTNDAYLEYMVFMSDEEGRRNGNSDLKKDFDRMIKEYEEQTPLIDNLINNKTKVSKSSREIDAMLDELYRLPTAGHTLRLIRDKLKKRLYYASVCNDDVIINI